MSADLNVLVLHVNGADLSVAAPPLPNPVLIVKDPGPMIAAGAASVASSPILSAGQGFLNPADFASYHAGVAVAQHAATPEQVSTIASSLPVDQQPPFALGVAIMNGAASAPPPPPEHASDPAAVASWFAIHGAATSSPDVKAAVATPIVQSGHDGADAAAHAAASHLESWWSKLSQWWKCFPFCTTRWF
jgi:hypothetical protein